MSALFVGSGWRNLAPKMGTSMALPTDSRREAKRPAGRLIWENRQGQVVDEELHIGRSTPEELEGIIADGEALF